MAYPRTDSARKYLYIKGKRYSLVRSQSSTDPKKAPKVITEYATKLRRGGHSVKIYRAPMKGRAKGKTNYLVYARSKKK